jgi:hypothetical protein
MECEEKYSKCFLNVEFLFSKKEKIFFRSDPSSSTIHHQLIGSVHGRVCMNEREGGREVKRAEQKMSKFGMSFDKKFKA